LPKIELYTPHRHQKPIHTSCNDSTSFFISVNAGRQSGKTALSQQQALYWAIDKPKVIVYWVSPTQSQVSKVYKQILEMVVEVPITKSYKGAMGDTEIVFKNGSQIKFRSGAQEDSLRGETIDYLIIDEAAFVKQSVFQEILLPMLNVRGKKCLLISTPKGKNWFFHQYQRGLDSDALYKSFKFTSQDNPYSNMEIIKIAKDNLPDILFRQEYLGEFVDSAAIFENLEELSVVNMLDDPNKDDMYFIGIDIALKDDYTVVNIINQHDEVVYYDRFNQTTAPDLKDRLIKIFDKWTPKKIMIEENNQGLPILQDLKKAGVKHLVGFKTTAPSKLHIINNLINAFASKTIKVPNCDTYKSELEVFEMTISPNGQPKFSAPSPFHDDIPMSLAITWECKNKYKYSGQYNFI